MPAVLLPPEKRRSACVALRLTEAQRAEAERLARENDSTMSTVLRDLLRDRLGD